MSKCQYCGVKTPIQCLECDTALCNSFTEKATHAVFHLVRNGHVRLALNDTPIICGTCGEANIFKLGFESLESLKEHTHSHTEETRYSHPSNASLTPPSDNDSDSTADLSDSQPLPTFICTNCRPAPPAINHRSLAFLPTRPSTLTLETLNSHTPSRIPLRTDAHTYFSTLIKLLKIEASFDKNLHKKMRYENVSVSFEGNHCHFQVNTLENMLRVSVGGQIRFLHRSGLSFYGTICEELYTDVIHAYIEEETEDLPRTGYTIECIWNEAVYKRMHWALQRIFSERQKNPIIPFILTGTSSVPCTLKPLQSLKATPSTPSQKQPTNNTINTTDTPPRTIDNQTTLTEDSHTYIKNNGIFNKNTQNISDTPTTPSQTPKTDTPQCTQRTHPPETTTSPSAQITFKEVTDKLTSTAITASPTQTNPQSPQKNPQSPQKNQQSPEVLTPPGFVPLNTAQRLAIQASLTQTLTLIQGPPGTGKTVVSAAIVFNLVRHFGRKVLVVAPSNIAVDQLCLRINATGLKVLRVMSKRRETVFSETEFLSLHRLLKNHPRRSPEETEALRHEIICAAEVVCCTCATAGQRLFNNIAFPCVLLDEAVQATEPLSLVPCTRGVQKLVMVGDHRQLGPLILSKEAADRGLRYSLFERLIQLGMPPLLLDTQYRMHPTLCQFPSEYFYGGLLRTGIPSAQRLNFPACLFYVCHGREEPGLNGSSFVNRAEAVVVEGMVRLLCKQGVRENQIGVITPYEAQRVHILGKVFGREPGNLEVANIDSFQGREKDFIILSLVRANPFQSVGFVGDRRRLNVALTRARRGLVIIGDPFTYMKCPIWRHLLRWYDAHGCIYEGPVEALRRTSLLVLGVERGEV